VSVFRAARLFANGAPGQVASGWDGALAAARSAAPYLERLAERDADIAARIAREGPQGVIDDAVAAVRAADGSFEDVMAHLRLAKRHLHLATAVGDLAGAFSLDEVTGALSDLADASLAAALRIAAREATARGDMGAVAPDDPRGPAPGLILIAMGKHGARELNYSSDIDISVFYDADILPVAKGEPRELAVRLAQLIVRALQEITVDGYVFRTDLRLRPDPASTPIAVSLDAAEHYYQSVGQNWERAAFIKARACAGDIAAGEAFLQTLTPFIWRRHLDYAAIADVHSIKRQILAAHKGGALDSGVFDVKLGRGGIRDIELFAQTQQLILGGRDKALRRRRTVEALAALRAAGHVEATAEAALVDAYRLHRAIEHRIQMLADEQTHRTPNDADDQARLAALAGAGSWAELEAELITARRTVADIDAKLFPAEESLADPLGSLVFTGVENDPDTLETLSRLGFQEPAVVAEAVRGWHHGRIRATRSERARELLTAIMPRLLRAIAESGEPDAAFARFCDFLGGLSSGVTVFALMQAQPPLLSDLADVFGLSPLMADILARRPALLDAMVEPAFVRPLAQDEAGARRATLERLVSETDGFEPAINAARRFHREEALRIGLQVLQSRASAADAGAAFADLADACVAVLSDVAVAEVARLHGRPPGAFAVLAVGKFGGRELAARSDLDVMAVFDGVSGVESDGARPLPAAEYFIKVTQRLVSALSAPTEEGLLYDVDMQLRPSGSKGPVAVSLAGFAHYYEEEAWTWELLALTRVRIAAGDGALGARVMETVARIAAAPRNRDAILSDAAAMRARMDKERPGRGVWDLKLQPGGLVDIEFIAQALSLGAKAYANTGDALRALVSAGRLSDADGALLHGAWTLYSDLQQVLRVCMEDLLEPARASQRLKALLARTGNAADFAALEIRLQQTAANVRAVFARTVGEGDGTAPLGR